MVTTTTKTLNYSIIRGNHTNSVNATITSTPGFNVNYFGKIPGILKLVELIVTVVALGLVASRRREGYVSCVDCAPYRMEMFMVGEVFFLCICAAGLTYLFGQLTTFAWSVVSSVLIPKTTYFEMVINLLLALAWITAGIVELVLTEREAWADRSVVDRDQNVFNRDQNGAVTQTVQNVQYVAIMHNPDWGCRIAAGSLALFLGVFHLISFVLAVKEFKGPRNQA